MNKNRKSKVKTKEKESFSVKDFKMWLMGMTEFQEPNWTPNEKQWRAILDKVELLEETVQDTMVVQQAPAIQSAHNPAPAAYTPQSQVNHYVPPASSAPQQPIQINTYDISGGTPDIKSSEPRFQEEQPQGPSFTYERPFDPKTGAGRFDADT